MTGDPASRASAILEIDLTAIVDNWRLLAAKAAPAECAAVVKANAYGLGAEPVARALAAAGCRLFFVASLEEGLALRGTVPDAAEIAVLNGPPAGTTGEFFDRGLVPVLNTSEQIAEWREAGRRHGPLPAMLHVDTGMSRLGLTLREFERLAPTLQPMDIRWRTLISHLACAELCDHPYNPMQRARFAALRERLPGVTASLAASSGIFLGREYHFDLVRPGAALYGLNPQSDRPNPLRPVVRLRGKILQIREIDRGESVGYGAAHVMPAGGRLATVAVGYADGWLRSLSHRGYGTIAGTQVPLVGRISMDLVTFDVSAVDPAHIHPGDFIELLGAARTVDAAAADAGTIGYEILTSLGSRYHRVYRTGPG